MAPTIKVPIRVGGAQDKSKPKKPNAVRRIMEREENRERRVREKSATVSSAANQPGLITTSRRPCPAGCENPQVHQVDGLYVCMGCSAQDKQDNTISNEITFGEAQNGAAVVQGNFLAADQGAVRPSGGYAFRRTAGSGTEARERSIREVKGMLQQWTIQLKLSESLVESGLQLYKIVSNKIHDSPNFVQGRRRINVAAVCLYAVSRKESDNQIMLIDLADIIKTDVFLLGRDYKNLLSQFTAAREGLKPIIFEDLIFRFATKLEFLHDTQAVATSAVRIVKRMQEDNMTHGRRPAGICGAAIIMAARAHNYRRTVREVVYIAKVTMATLQERMEEFANVPSAQMTIGEFYEQDFLKSSHDPPSVYKQTKEWKEKHPGRRKRKAQEISRDAPNSGAAAQETGPASAPAPVIDKDGFVVPPLPQRAAEPAGGTPSDAHDLSTIATATAEGDEQLEVLASEYGDPDSEDSDLDPNSEVAMAAAQGIVPIPSKKSARKEKSTSAEGTNDVVDAKKKATLVIDEEWEMEEDNLEAEMESHLRDPTMIGASKAIQKAVEDQRAKAAAETADSSSSSAAHTTSATAGTTSTSKVSDDPIVHEDEFKDDPEVMYCRLGEEEVKIKEMIWANHNKDYMRMQQKKIFESKMSQNGPPKQRRNRAKKPRIGEGQLSPAESAEEAAFNMMRTRGISTKLDYSRLGQVFNMSKRGPGSTYAGASSTGSRSALPSALASEAGSEMGSDGEEESSAPAKDPTTAVPASETATGELSLTQSLASAFAKRAERQAEPRSTPAAEDVAESEMGDDDDYECASEIDHGQDEYGEDTYMERGDAPFGGEDYDEEE
ncbi:transcription factor iiib-like protein [Podospora aff. communis PSN243]|uniref:Transcription factor iiib-like protein n=1 Tax=Podospora aff. communis PSN243 TaxID=3040156 RepID=A0AAV9G906_9PEZI|nr:transcription factor iiib-like protein [Podospora aff. communis PSN243]